MVRRFGIVALVIAILLGLIAYSKFRPVSSRVSGFIEADEIRVGSRLGGRVLQVHVSEGQRVQQGQLLVQLEPFDLLQREQEAAESLAALEADYQRLQAGFRSEEIAQAEARVQQHEARHDLLVAGPRPQEIEAARGRLQFAESEQVLAQQNYNRSKRLIVENAISQEEFDSTMERLEATSALIVVRKQELELLLLGSREEEIREAKARLEEAEQAWALEKNGYRKEEIERARAARDAAQAALEVIREQKKELAITCPIDGVIEALDLQKGDLVPTNAPVLSIMDTSHLWVRAYVPQNQVGLQVGQTLSMTVDCFPDETLQGEISFISREAEFTPSNVQTPEERAKQVFRIKVNLKDPRDRLRPGMSVDVWLDSASDPS